MADPISIMVIGAAAGVVAAASSAVGAGVGICALAHNVYKGHKKRKEFKRQRASSNTPTIIYIPGISSTKLILDNI